MSLLVIVLVTCALAQGAASRPAATGDERDPFEHKDTAFWQQQQQQRAAMSTYSPALALDSVLLSAAAYCDADSLPSWTCGGACEQLPRVQFMGLAYNISSDAQAFVALGTAPSITTPSVMISFRGTMPSHLRNWIDNLNTFVTHPYPDAPDVGVHEGFYYTMLSIKEQLFAHLTYALSKVSSNSPIIVTGHSLGGALAVLFALELSGHVRSHPIKVYTFGEPRVGGHTFPAYVVGKLDETIRVTHWRDIVPHVPLHAMSFRHEPREVFYDSYFTTYKLCDNSGEDPDCADSLVGYSISDHLTYLNVTISHDCTAFKYHRTTPDSVRRLR